MKIFGERLKELRTERKLTQRELALQTKLTQSAIASWEVDRQGVTAESLVVLAKFFNTSVDYLLGLKDE